jgi:hypothetical protein
MYITKVKLWILSVWKEEEDNFRSAEDAYVIKQIVKKKPQSFI